MEIKFLPKPKTFHLQLHITERCNLRCKHCYQNQKYIKKELTTNAWFRIIDNWIDLVEKLSIEKNNVRLTFIGGEPLIRKDFFKLLEKCYENKDKFIYDLATNGCLIDENTARKLKDLGIEKAQISLDGLKEKNDLIRGAGTFDKIIESVDILKKFSIKVSLSLTVSKYNKDDILKLTDLCKKLNINLLHIRRFVPCGRGEEMKRMMLEPEELKSVYEIISKRNEKFKDNSFKIATGCEDSLWFIEDSNFETHGCSLAYDSFSILPNGDVFPCRKVPIKVGNATHQGLFEIW
jgi:MoaA/NifB/PqqE/SkfB family radical SAM enzyme